MHKHTIHVHALGKKAIWLAFILKNVETLFFYMHTHGKSHKHGLAHCNNNWYCHRI